MDNFCAHGRVKYVNSEVNREWLFFFQPPITAETTAVFYPGNIISRRGDKSQAEISAVDGKTDPLTVEIDYPPQPRVRELHSCVHAGRRHRVEKSGQAGRDSS